MVETIVMRQDVTQQVVKQQDVTQQVVTQQVVKQQVVKQQVVNPHTAKWAHLQPNRHCSLTITQQGSHQWKNPEGYHHRVDENGIQDGPAVIYPDGYLSWYFNGKCHRLDGPAVIFPDGRQFWYLEDILLVSQEEWARDPRVIEHNSRTQEGGRRMDQETLDPVAKKVIERWAHLKPNRHCSLTVSSLGNRVWENPQGRCHRTDESGHQDGPAVIWADGDQTWYLDGLRHRLDGPACIFTNGHQDWYLDDICLSREKWTQDLRVILYNSQTQEGAEEWLKRL